MQELTGFRLEFLRVEQHLMLPRASSIVVTQTLYDILFQYVITEEKEQKLLAFIKQLEKHIKSKARAPFSMPLSDFGFLDDGLQELKLLNWAEIPVYVFSVQPSQPLAENNPEPLETFMDMLEGIMICSRLQDGDILYVYPNNLVRY